MKIEIRKVNDERGILQITTVDERFYAVPKAPDGYTYYPSSTWIASYYPKGIAYFKWLANHGWDEAESLKTAAGEKGSKVHHAIADLLGGKTVSIDAKYANNDGEPEELTPEEYECIMSFVAWHKSVNPKMLSSEKTVLNIKEGYAGTIDFLCEINNKVYLIDFKTSQYIWPSHEIQIASYLHADGIPKCTPAVLQLGYKRNRNKYKFTELDDKYHLFLAAKQIWAEECSKIVPLQKDYPLQLTLKKEVKNG